MLNNLVSAVTPKEAVPSLDLDIDVESTWEDVSSSYFSTATPSEKTFRENVNSGLIASPMNKVRLFNADKESDVRVTFYRDHASWCPYCHKVWATLELKEISYRVEKVNMRCYGQKPPSFLRLQPNGNIPVAKIDGTVLRQSNDIIFALESLFPESKPIMYSESERERGDGLMKLERELFTAWMYYLTGSRDPERYRTNFISVLNKVESALLSSPSSKGFFMGDRPTIVDVMFLPFLERMVTSMIYFKGLEIRDPETFPSICRWFDSMEELPAVRLTKSDHYTHCWDLPPQLGGCGMEEDGERYAQAIDGERDLLDPTKSSWTLPLTANLGGAELDWGWISPLAARRECAERFLHNHGAVSRFAARGGGKGGKVNKGFPPASAPLADPNATPEEALVPSIEILLAALCYRLLEDDGSSSKKADELVSKAAKAASSAGLTTELASSVAYLRDRIGVPRDMSAPAARWARGCLNEIIAQLTTA